MENSKRSRDQLARRASQFFLITATLTVLYVMAHVFELIGFIGGTWDAETLLSRLPGLFYIYALVCLCLIFRRLARKAEFDIALGGLLRNFGLAVSAGGLLTVFVNPILGRLLFSRGAFLNFDRSAMLLMVAGFIFTMIGLLIRDYADVKKELGEFV
ncbi:hypothetical protein [Porphyrobacter sp. YT40]|uniref:hypothetical protein n=1 Tax=Porphyrobacter sp. YT40 TaxID=2547601 RepID=UPI001143220C|nr:hypothetical protein [Porphyrobacter sp. YT40]QDH33670.1 hypothetical protein E2E27_04525 [Porphyrobacter sp. YT40]